MGTGYFLVRGDKTTCGGKIIEGADDHTIMGIPQARDMDRVTCGKHPGMFIIVGGVPETDIHGRLMAGSLDSQSSCPCKARFIASMMDDVYEVETEKTENKSVMPLNPLNNGTGNSSPPAYTSDYPALRNTHNLPDQQVRDMLANNNHDVMLLTYEEGAEVLQSWGCQDFKRKWVDITQSAPGQLIINYGVNGKDVVTTSIVLARLGDFGIKATAYVNHKGTELIKLTGYPGIRKILNAPVFAAKNPKIVDVGIGKYGLTNSIVKGARLTFYVAAAYRTIDFILNDETSLAEFIGALATDVGKIAIASAVSWGAGKALLATGFVAGPLVGVVVVGIGAALLLNYLDNKFGLTDQVVAYIEAAQQEFVEKAREIEEGIWDLGAMWAKHMLIKGKEVLEHEVKEYLKDKLNNVSKWELK